jgi:hypothetical protein
MKNEEDRKERGLKVSFEVIRDQTSPRLRLSQTEGALRPGTIVGRVPIALAPARLQDNSMRFSGTGVSARATEHETIGDGRAGGICNLRKWAHHDIHTTSGDTRKLRCGAMLCLGTPFMYAHMQAKLSSLFWV